MSNPEDEGIGEVKDVILDADEGHATFALVSFGGVLVFFSDTAAVPWSALEFDAEENEYALNTTQGVLDTAKIDADDYKRLENEEFSRSIHTAFKTEPYWVIHGYVSPEAGRTVEPQASTGVGAKPMTLMGTVQDIDTFAATPSEEKVVRVTMRTPAGETKTVLLAPQARLDELKLKVDRDKQITLSGYEKKMADGTMVFQATDVTVDGKKCVLTK